MSLFTEGQGSPHAQKLSLSLFRQSAQVSYPNSEQGPGGSDYGNTFSAHCKRWNKMKGKKKKKKTAIQVVRCVAESVYFLGLDVEEELFGER